MIMTGKKFIQIKHLARVSLLAVIFLAQSCLEDNSSRAGKKFIQDFSKTTTPEATTKCAKYVTLSDTQCLTRCPTGMHIGTQDEILAQVDALLFQSGDDASLEAQLQERISGVKGVCLSDITRPSDQVYIQSVCGCLGSLPDILNNCSSVCASRNDLTPTLFGTVTLGSDIALNSLLGNLHNWCTVEIGDGLAQPECQLELRNGTSIYTKPVSTVEGSNTFSVDLNGIPLNMTFAATIYEKKSGAKSKSFNVRRYSASDSSSTPTTPLKLMPITQYTCITRTGSATVDGEIYTNAARIHFYFAQDARPVALRPGQNFLICHDTVLYGNNDSQLYPRLEELPGQFVLWDQTDSRFFDQDQTNKLDVNELISKRLLDEYNITNNSINIFGEFRWPSAPSNPETADGSTASGSSSSTTIAPLLGFYMQPWIDSSSGHGFCPKQSHYNGSDPVFNILKEIVGVDTEGLYIAVKEEEILNTTTGTTVPAPQDVLFIREGLLKKIWFYFENNQHLVPTEVTANSKTIMFYWPADITNPYVKKSTQKLYTIRSAENLTTSQNQGGLRTTVRPGDKRFGCVPAID